MMDMSCTMLVSLAVATDAVPSDGQDEDTNDASSSSMVL